MDKEIPPSVPQPKRTHEHVHTRFPFSSWDRFPTFSYALKNILLSASVGWTAGMSFLFALLVFLPVGALKSVVDWVTGYKVVVKREGEDRVIIITGAK